VDRGQPVALVEDPTVAAPANEAFEVLRDLANRRRELEPFAPMLAERALRVTTGADFAVARDALEAMLRRFDSSRAVVVRRAPHGYRAFRPERSGNRYEVWIGRDATGSCTCPDFAKASLGLCKHLFAVLRRASYHHSEPRALRWDPIRPLTGKGDRVARIWHDPQARLPRKLAGLFQATPAARPIDPAALLGARRLETIESLIAACRRDPQLAEPMLLSMLEDERATARRGLVLTTRELDRMLRGLKRHLYPYQREGVARFLRAGRLLLADDMGLGKTAQAIASCHALIGAKHVSRTLIVAPASLKPQWVREWQAFTDIAITMVEGGPQEREEQYRTRRGSVLLVNYEQLLRDLPLAREFDPQLVILDEAQRIKNWETRTADVVKQLEPAWRLVLTGTPMENRLEELSSIMEWVDEQALEPRWRLPSWHSIRVDGSREVVGARNLDTLRTRLAPAMLRRVRRDVLAQLPARRDTQIPVTLTIEQQAAHDDLDRPIARLAGSARQRPLTQPEFLKLMALLAQQRMICNALVLRDFTDSWPTFARSRRRTDALVTALGSPKLADFRERIVDLVVTQQRKVVVFSQWRRMLQLADWVCGDVLQRHGIRAVFFTGQESQRRRTENLVAFHDDPAARILFASDAGGVGLNLQRAASCCINLELPWNPAVLEQRVGRILRLGQTQPVEVYNYVATGGIEERIAHLVGGKRALFEGLFDGTSDEVAFDASASFISRVHQILAPAAEPDHGDSDTPEPEAIDDADDAEPAAPSPSPSASASSHPLAITTDATELVRVLSQIEARPLGDGRIALELPAAAASALGSMLRALAAAVEGPRGA
jgi:superfamily II DNA or RNA helicase